MCQIYTFRSISDSNLFLSIFESGVNRLLRMLMTSIWSWFQSTLFLAFITRTIAASISYSLCFITESWSASNSCFCCLADPGGNAIYMQLTTSYIIFHLGKQLYVAYMSIYWHSYLSRKLLGGDLVSKHEHVRFVDVLLLRILILLLRDHLILEIHKRLNGKLENLLQWHVMDLIGLLRWTKVSVLDRVIYAGMRVMICGCLTST